MGGRRRSRGRGTSRRTFLAGSCIAVGSGLLLTDAGAFTQTVATRGASVGVDSDESAILGLDIVSVAGVGDENEILEVTNNTDEQLEATVELLNTRAGESIDPTAVMLLPGESEQVTAVLDPERTTDEEAVALSISGSSDGLDIDLTRTVPVPSFSWYVVDNSEHENVQFDLQYTVDVPNFDTVDIEVVNTNSGASEQYSRMTPKGTVTYPKQGLDSEAGGTDYDITFTVYDAAERAVLTKEVTITGGESGGEGSPGDETDPTLDWVFVDDLSEEATDAVKYAVYYQVSTLEDFGEVEIEFDYPGDWASNKVSRTQTPVGMAEHTKGNTGNPFDIIVTVKDSTGMIVDSVTRSDVADGENPTNPDITESDSPTFATLDISDESGNGGAEYVVEYTIDNENRFAEVQAQFENLSGSSETNETITDTSGTLTYSAGYTEGGEYRITIRIFEDRGGALVPTTTEVVTDIADGEDP